MAEIRVPTLGKSVTEATIGKWFKKPGDPVAVDEPMVELETDKVTIEVPAPAAGTLGEIAAKDGETVAVGALLGSIKEGAGAPAKPAAAQSRAAEAKPTRSPRLPPAAPPKVAAADAPLAPSVRKMAAETGMDPAKVDGSGKDGRVTKGDMMAAIERAAAQPTPVAQPAAAVQVRAPSPADDAAREERVKMTRLRQTIARRLKDAQNTAAMLTTYNEVDMSAIMAMRNQYKELFEKKPRREARLHELLRARLHPGAEGNAGGQRRDRRQRPDLQELLPHRRRGRHRARPRRAGGARLRSALARRHREGRSPALGKKARDGQLKIEDMQGGTFTISNGGVYGSLMSMPILNAPQSGILGMHKIQERPVVVAGKIEIRPMMYLALTYDHRVVDGQRRGHVPGAREGRTRRTRRASAARISREVMATLSTISPSSAPARAAMSARSAPRSLA